MNSTLVFGGTFDPVHRGHIESAQAVGELLGDVDTYLVPCQIPAHRPAPAASPADRLRMLELAVADHDRMFVDGCELEREGVSYTFDTLREYRGRTGESTPLLFMMGLDAWVTLPTWHRWQELTDLAHLVVLARPGSEKVVPSVLQDWCESRRVEHPQEMLGSASGRVCFLSLAQIAVSASGLREALKRGESIEGDVDPQVAAYIRQHNLYTGSYRATETVPAKKMEQ